MRVAFTGPVLAALFALSFAAGACRLLPTAKKSPPPAAAAPAAAQPPARPKFVSPNLQHTRAELEARVAVEIDGYLRQGESTGTLEAFAPVEVPVKRGLCYKVAFVLDEGVAFSDHAMESVVFVVSEEGKPPRQFMTAFGPGGVVDMGCPNGAATTHLDVQATAGSYKDKSRLHELGTGGFKTSVYAKKISEKGLAERNEQIRQAEEREAESLRYFRAREAARKEQEAEEQRKRDREWNARRTGSGPDCKRQCAASYTSCTQLCGSRSDCRGRCQTDEWKCKDACR